MVDAPESVVAIVGGGPAGAALAIHLASAGIETTLFERRAELGWRACGVFASPLARSRLLDLGLSQTAVAALSRPISALNLRTTNGDTCRLEYGATGHANGFDRPALDQALLDRARAVGADVQMGAVVRSIELPPRDGNAATLTISSHERDPSAEPHAWRARLVIGADGPHSLVCRTAGVTRGSRLLRKAGVTFHRADAESPRDPSTPVEGQFLFGNGWYVGVAPVPRGRVNVGMVLPAAMLRRPVAEVAARLLGHFPEPRDPWQSAPMTDAIRVAVPLVHRVERAAGNGYALVGDAAGFIDPLTGEGLHRALVSAELAADGIGKWLRGDAQAMEQYDRRLRARFRNKDVVSWLLQAFLAQPAVLGYALRRLGSREGSRKTFTLVMTDQVPASRALDPRFLARLLAP